VGFQDRLEVFAKALVAAIVRPPDLSCRPAVAFWVGERRAVVGQHRVDLVRNGVDQASEKASGNAPGDPFMQFGENRLAGATSPLSLDSNHRLGSVPRSKPSIAVVQLK